MDTEFCVSTARQASASGRTSRIITTGEAVWYRYLEENTLCYTSSSVVQQSDTATSSVSIRCQLGSRSITLIVTSPYGVAALIPIPEYYTHPENPDGLYHETELYGDIWRKIKNNALVPVGLYP